jgi:hypothetical protein
MATVGKCNLHWCGMWWHYYYWWYYFLVQPGHLGSAFGTHLRRPTALAHGLARHDGLSFQVHGCCAAGQSPWRVDVTPTVLSWPEVGSPPHKGSLESR